AFDPVNGLLVVRSSGHTPDYAPVPGAPALRRNARHSGRPVVPTPRAGGCAPEVVGAARYASPARQCRGRGGSAMSFQGWPEAALDFFEGLERENTKAYWTANRQMYDEAVLGPMTELTEELSPEFGAVKILRPYRDVRFSADKSPYKTEIGAMLGSAYIRLSA